MAVCHLFWLILLLLWSQESTPRTWRLATGETIEASFVSFEAGQIILALASESTRAVPFADLSSDDQKEVMRLTGWGRVWEDDTGKYRTVADLVRVEPESVILEKIDGTEINVSLSRLSKFDRQYIEARRDISEKRLPETFSGKVVALADGDTVTVLINRRQFKVRLDAIDAPEIGQDFSAKSKSLLSELVGEKIVTGKTLGGDKYGRNLCRLFVDGLEVNAEMIRQGLAWHYEQYSDDQELKQLQEQAKAEQKNLWSQPGPVPPWEWRRWSGAQRKNWFEQHSGRGPPVEASVADSESTDPVESASTVDRQQAAALSYWLNTSSGVRHNAGCRWYRNTKAGRDCGSNEGRACGICGG